MLELRQIRAPWVSWRRCLALTVAVVLLALTPGGAYASDVDVSVVQPGDTMTLRYEPSTLTVTVGDTITWTNNGATPVTVTSPDGLFDSETVQPGSSFSHVFDTPGTFRYFCVPYPHMKGVIVVAP